MMERPAETAEAMWTRMQAERSNLMAQIESYASMTLPKICLPDGVTTENATFTNEYQSIGAQAVNHLANKLMLAMFAPSRPSFRLVPTDALRRQLVDAGIDEDDIAPVLAEAERSSARELDARGQRPKLYSACKHLIVTGNVLMHTPKDGIRILGMRYWCVKRDVNGKLHTLIKREVIKADELEPDLQEFAHAAQADTEVSLYTIVRRNGKKYDEEVWVGESKLPSNYSSTYSEDDNPWHVLTWDLGDDSDYATGLVGEYAADFERITAMSEAVSDASILGLDVRYLVDATASTSVEDLQKGRPGDYIPGRKGDIDPVVGGNPQMLAAADVVLQRYEKRIAQAFILHSAIVRSAERVTAEEIRMVAQELEASLGGVYSSLAGTMQSAVAKWLLKSVSLPFDSKLLNIAIVTGLDALSRNGDLEALQRGLEILAKVQMLPPDLQARIKMDKLASKVGQGVGYDLSSVLMSDEEYQQAQTQAAAARSAEAGVTAQAEQAAQPQGM
jgi:hypothetical protein